MFFGFNFSQKYGLYYLNMTSPNKDRIAKKSAHYYGSVIDAKEIVDNLN